LKVLSIDDVCQKQLRSLLKIQISGPHPKSAESDSLEMKEENHHSKLLYQVLLFCVLNMEKVQ
jgi:hypothetical protein